MTFILGNIINCSVSNKPVSDELCIQWDGLQLQQPANSTQLSLSKQFLFPGFGWGCLSGWSCLIPFHKSMCQFIPQWYTFIPDNRSVCIWRLNSGWLCELCWIHRHRPVPKQLWRRHSNNITEPHKTQLCTQHWNQRSTGEGRFKLPF